MESNCEIEHNKYTTDESELKTLIDQKLQLLNARNINSQCSGEYITAEIKSICENYDEHIKDIEAKIIAKEMGKSITQNNYDECVNKNTQQTPPAGGKRQKKNKSKKSKKSKTRRPKKGGKKASRRKHRKSHKK
jgi:hypothetical protein